ncbi:MAG: tRNA 2-thiocytidine(32) synthetase TtcA [Gammaproteobacteria bacterium]|nr:tRNA 2-thiocytidine(32) synthetase TtcA [Gammaproteobacteria bacterium]PCH64765.1 MAG: tRNA 2-thiocytidine(32) synthetase TtcA [Gammaproteobacteria bacterium]
MVKLEKKLLHYITKAIADYTMITKGDRVMVCLSGGKDSFTMLYLLNEIRKNSHNRFSLHSYTLDQSQPGWNDEGLRAWLEEQRIPNTIEKRDTYSIVTEKIPVGKTYCSLCSRLRRGNIYRFAEDNGFNKIALGHHRDDMIHSMLMSMLYNGQIRSMPPKLLTDNKRNIVIRPLAYCKEADIIEYAKIQAYPIIPCNLCGSQENLKRQRVKRLVEELAAENDKVPSNLFGALSNIQPSQLMDKDLWDFAGLEDGLILDNENETEDLKSQLTTIST